MLSFAFWLLSGIMIAAQSSYYSSLLLFIFATGVSGMLRDDLLSALSDMETMAKTFGIEPFDLYLLGGSGCVIAEYLDRATRDFDIIDMEYSSRLGRVLKLLEPYDIIDIQMATIASSFRDRALRLDRFEYLGIYVLSREDIIVSKLGRYSPQDVLDIKTMMPDCQASVLFQLIIEVLDRVDLISRGKIAMVNNAKQMFKDCDLYVPDYVQQLEKLLSVL